jgi:hypothetical protein
VSSTAPRHSVVRAPDPAAALAPAASRVAGRFTWWFWPERDEQPGRWVALAIPCPVAPGTPVVVNGWQSWSSARTSRVGAPAAIRASAALPPGISPRQPVDLPALPGTASWDLLVAGGPDGPGFVAGVRGGGALLILQPEARRLLVLCEAGGPRPTVLVAETVDDRDRDRAVSALLDQCRPAAATRPAPRGIWCTWGGRWQRDGRTGSECIDEAQLAAALGPLAGLAGEGLLEVAQLDDGWQAAIGDWEAGPAFPSGLPGLATRVVDAGLTPGIWWAPACAAPGSRLVRDHPDLVLRDGRGRPVVAATVGHWGGAVWALDVSRRDVQDHIAGTAARLAGAGFSYQKLDFVYAAALPGRRARPLTGAAGARATLAAVRRGAPDAFLLGCGAPLWPSIGLVDAMRIGPDITATWDPPVPRGLHPGQQAGLRSALAALRHRRVLHDRLWINDADHLLLRGRDVPAGWAAQERFARAVGESGTLLAFADRPDEIDARGWDLWAELVHARAAHAPVPT